MIVSKALTGITTFLCHSFNSPVKVIAALLGVLWASLEPAVPFITICTFFVFMDCLSAWMLARRVKRYYPEKALDAKFKSEHASEIFNTLAIIYMLVIGGYWLDKEILSFVTIHIGNWIAAAFCLVQMVSVLENSSSCNGSTWAIVVQKVLTDKTKRHLKVDMPTLVKEAKKEAKAKDEERYNNVNLNENENENENIGEDADAEEKKRLRSERARKAWETRRRKSINNIK